MVSGLISHADKVLFAERGDTKGDLAEHYERVAGPLMRTMGGRPVLLQRFPEGAGGPSFFQKRVPKNIPDWLQTTTVATPNGTTSQALVAADLDHVLWAVNLGCLGFHVWPYLAADADHADELRIDLDPTPGVDFTHIRQAAHELQVLLAEVGITGYPKTTGNRGLHWSDAGPTSSRRRGGRKNAASGCSSITTRTPRTRPSSAHGRSAPGRARRSPRRSPGERSTRSILISSPSRRWRSGSPRSATPGRP